MNSNEKLILSFLQSKGENSARTVSESTKLPYSSVMSLLNALAEKTYVVLRKEEKESVCLTDEGKNVASKGLPELRLLSVLSQTPVPLSEALAKSGLTDEEKPIALKWVKQKNLAKIQDGKLAALNKPQVEFEAALKQLSSSDSLSKSKFSSDVLNELLQRKIE